MVYNTFTNMPLLILIYDSKYIQIILIPCETLDIKMSHQEKITERLMRKQNVIK